jgi:NDP-sugar pyrophosphorylase family protein
MIKYDTMKQRITLTLDRNLLKKIDQRIDGLNIRNRSHAIELILKKHLEPRIKTAVILCGGKGTRLRPITYEIPKALIPVQGKPLIDHIFDLLKKYNIKDVVVSVGYLKEKIKQHLGDGFRFGINITYIEEDKPLGTAGPLKLFKKIKQPKEAFIVSNGDELKNIHIQKMFELHQSKHALATIALTTVKDPSLYGVARLDGSRILEFVEKPAKNKAPSNLINAGFYILEPEVIDMIPDGFSMLEKNIFPKLAKQGKLFGFPFGGQWFDTGNIKRYEKAIKQWKQIK